MEGKGFTYKVLVLSSLQAPLAHPAPSPQWVCRSPDTSPVPRLCSGQWSAVPEPRSFPWNPLAQLRNEMSPWSTALCLYPLATMRELLTCILKDGTPLGQFPWQPRWRILREFHGIELQRLHHPVSCMWCPYSRYFLLWVLCLSPKGRCCSLYLLFSVF